MSFDDERTRIVPRSTHSGSSASGVEIRYPGPDGQPSYGKYTHAFTIGREENCTIRLAVPGVSRRRVEIFQEDGAWWVHDLGSSNGTLVNGRPIDRLPLVGTLTLELGHQEPRIRVTAPPPSPPPPVQEATPQSRFLEDISSTISMPRPRRRRVNVRY